MTADRTDGIVIFEAPRACPGCQEPLEHTGDKLYYCASCHNFFIELDGSVQHYLVDPPETGRRRQRLVVAPA